MKHSYRVTKYYKYDDQGTLFSSSDEWTSFYDVGTKVDLNNYLVVEKLYLDFIMAECSAHNIDFLEISSLEADNKEFPYREKEIVSGEDIRKVAKHVLREDAWCKLVSKDLQIHFGYDFYMYLVSNSPIDKSTHTNSLLNIEEFRSPYL
ncbi:hypothetical protein [Halomonas binhaiensis]|uniref:Uncharacterized protein n=1 Tax=Halomonas binhaiensis TaxID=2562282 RepID=A0A5C1NII1_9GAMM|nr:hypothetical protein [Halomonas binhaiensis]QEM82670.1 hypothetical protein E4T21_14775 [Halomonas binhaiensis]